MLKQPETLYYVPASTNQRGEQHHLKLSHKNIEKEILIAIYIQAIINKQTQTNS
ncbi:hypothetical protein [Staphylococcus marylandisciuri]|uniref:hypothetical protein n=1 Tax=Staphylococcus marylandisciuri TaxID=2981529 RepID=UPI0021D1E870|nr:hypothetical protein [Staphylococcus marylandisciuri]